MNSIDDPLLNRLNELTQETDPEFVLELIDIYLNETPKQIQAISTAVETNDMQTLATVAHKLKGTSMNLGAQKLGAICLMLQEAGRSGKEIPREASLAEIDTEFERVKSILQQFKRSV